MTFEKLGDAMARKDFEVVDDLLGFYELCRSVIKRRSGVVIESVNYKNEILRVTVSHPVEASEVRLRHIQIIRELQKKTERPIQKLVMRVL